MNEESPENEPEDKKRALFDPYTGKRLGNEAEPRKPWENAPVKKRRGGLVLLLAALLVTIVAAGAWYVTGPLAESQARDQAKADSAKAVKAEKVRAGTCEDLLADSYDSLASIDSRLDVGMVEGDFTSAVGEAKASFDRIDADKAETNDCSAYGDLEVAIEQYSKASDYWNDCIQDTYCTVDEATLNDWWSTSGDRLANVKTAGIGNAGKKTVT